MNERPLLILNRIKKLNEEIHSLHDYAKLIAVTKYSPIEDVVAAYEADQVDFGENRVNDLEVKAEFFKNHKFNNVRWHFIGHLQSNKVKDLLKIPNLYSIHSIDSMKLLEEVLKRMDLFEGEKLGIFLQVNTSQEDEKSGFESLEELKGAVALLIKSNLSIKFLGLMTLGTIRTEDVNAEAHRCFKELNRLKSELEAEFKLTDLKLSMGMSGDYQIALEHGADYIRIGSSIFK